MTQSELPVGWVKCKLEDLCEIISKGTTPKNQTEEPNYAKFLKAENITKESVIDLTDCKYIDKETHTTALKRSILKKNDILITIAGTLGRCAVVEIEENLNTNQAVCFARLLNCGISPHFIKYYALSPVINKKLTGKAKVTAIPNLTLEIVKNIDVSLPPLAEQKRIVGKIEELFAEVDKGIDLLKQKQAELKKYRQSVLSAAFSGKLYKTTEWQEKNIKDVALYIQRGKSPQYTDLSNYPIINQKCIRWNALEIEHLKYLTQNFFSKITPERFVQPNDILWNSTGTGTIGRAYLYKGNEVNVPVVVDSHVTIVRANREKILPVYLYYFIMSPTVQFSIESMQNGSTNQVELAREKIRTTSLDLPTLPEQEQLVAEIEQRFEKADILEKSIEDALESAEKLKQSILKKAFEGKLVPQDPNDEPASVLLNRIKSEQSPKKGKKK